MWRSAVIGSPELLTVGDSSPDSAETSFRELDDAFLQTQTRIWLGEVLHARFDENVGIADLLADGELLFQVSKKVWKMLLNKYGELKHSNMHIYERTSSGKSEGKYTPYPKVDSFLKICQILGLTGIDLFSPTDAVDKRDVRRVCMCIRSLSKKARVKNLEVPDFDIVICNVSMPTNLVGGIRRNLELSQYSSSTLNASTPEVLRLERTVYQKETIIADELGRNKDGDGRIVRKSGNRVLKSVARIITVVGALVLLLHVSGRKKGREKDNKTVVPLLVQKQNQEFFTKQKVNVGKSNSSYPGEKLKF